MAEQEKKVLLTVDTGSSEKTVKSLKKDISDLKDAILNLEKGSDAYNDAVEQLQQNQRELDEVMALTKKTATALDGSYDALVHQMSLLKKEWRATADEAKRADLGKQIDDINAQLKEMDASVGNFQRNVGNYVSHWEGMPEVTKDFGTAMSEMNQQIEPTKQKFESVGKIASGLASGFAAAQGAMALLGVESEDFEKTMIKIQSAMALAQGIGGLAGLVEGLGKAKVAFAEVGTTVKSVSKAMGATGWIAVIVAVTAAIIGLVTWIKKTKSESDNAKSAMKDLGKAMIENMSTITDSVAELKAYEKVATDVTAADDQRHRAAKKVLEILGETPNATNIAAVEEGKYAEKIQTTTQALIAQAKAQIALDKIKAKTAEIEAQKEKNLQKAQKKRDKADKNEEKGPNLGDALIAAGQNMGGDGQYVTATEVNNQQVADLRAEADALEASNAELDKALEEYVDTVLKNTDITLTTGGSGGGGGKTEKTADEIRDELVADFLESVENMEIPDIPIEVETTYEIKDKVGQAEKLANIRIKEAERVAKNEMLLNAASSKTVEEKAAKELEIKRKLEEDKLAILKKAKEEAIANNDLAFLEIEKQIANQTIAVKKAQYDEEERLRQENLEKEEAAAQKRIDITNQVSSALSAAGSVTQAILEITQAAAEKDGEITEKEAKKIKGMQIAVATMNMLAGITAAISGCFTTKTGPWDIALAAIQAATIAATGTANIMKIKNTDLTGKVTSGAQAAVTPNSNIYGTDLPMSYVRNVTTASETDALNQSTKVYVLESDIADAMNKVSVRSAEATF